MSYDLTPILQKSESCSALRKIANFAFGEAAPNLFLISS